MTCGQVSYTLPHFLVFLAVPCAIILFSRFCTEPYIDIFRLTACLDFVNSMLELSPVIARLLMRKFMDDDEYNGQCNIGSHGCDTRITYTELGTSKDKKC